MDEREPYRLSQAEIVEFCNEVGFALNPEKPETSILSLYLPLIQRIRQKNDLDLESWKLPSLNGGNIEDARKLAEIVRRDADSMSYQKLVEYALESQERVSDEARIRSLLQGKATPAIEPSDSPETPAMADTAIKDGKPCIDFVKLSKITYHLGIHRSTSRVFLDLLKESEKRRKTPTSPWEIDYNALVKALSKDSKYALPPLSNGLKKRPRKKR